MSFKLSIQEEQTRKLFFALKKREETENASWRHRDVGHRGFCELNMHIPASSMAKVATAKIPRILTFNLHYSWQAQAQGPRLHHTFEQASHLCYHHSTWVKDAPSSSGEDPLWLQGPLGERVSKPGGSNCIMGLPYPSKGSLRKNSQPLYTDQASG